MLLASLLLRPTTASAVGAGSGSGGEQTNAGSNSAGQADSDVRELELDRPLERDIAGGQRHSYQVTLSLRSVSACSRGAARHRRDRQAIWTGQQADDVTGRMGGVSEPLFLVAKEQGIYRIEIRSPESAAASSYGIKVEELRVACSQDSNRALAESALADGRAASIRKEWQNRSGRRWKSMSKLFGFGEPRATVEVRPKRSMTWGLCTRVWARIRRRSITTIRHCHCCAPWGNAPGKARHLTELASFTTRWGRIRRRLTISIRPSPLRRAVGDLGGEGQTLNNIGLVYASLGGESEGA